MMSAPNTPSSDALLILHSQAPDCTLTGTKPIPGCRALPEKPVFSIKDYLDLGSELKVKHFMRTSLTGNRIESEDDLDQSFDLEPMTLEAIKVQF